MKFDKPNKKQHDWRENVRMVGSIVSGSRPCQIHHVAGRRAKQDKHPIGHALILPLYYSEHTQIDQGLSGLRELKNARDCWRGDGDLTEPMSLHEFEKYLFSQLCQVIKFPFGEVVYRACLDWHR